MLSKRRLVTILAVLCCVMLFAVPRIVTAQDEEPSPEEMMNMMGPMMGNMMESMMESTFAIMAKPSTANRLASFTRNYYEALIDKGFSKEDALKIVTQAGFPSLQK